MTTLEMWSKRGMTAFIIICIFLVSVYPLFSSVQQTTPFMVRFHDNCVDSDWVIDPNIKQMVKSLDGEWIPIMIRFKDYINTSLVEEL